MTEGKVTWSNNKRIYGRRFVLDFSFEGYPGEGVCDAVGKRSELHIYTWEVSVESQGLKSWELLASLSISGRDAFGSLKMRTAAPAQHCCLYRLNQITAAGQHGDDRARGFFSPSSQEGCCSSRHYSLIAFFFS